MKNKAMNRLFALIMIVACAALTGHAIPATSLRMAHKAPKLNTPATNADAAYYTFNASRGGFVIVAGDDRVPAVLGYSDKGTFDPQDMPEAMQTLLEGYAAQINALDHGAKAAPHFINGNVIAPLVTAQWDQDAPYNLLCSNSHGPSFVLLEMAGTHHHANPCLHFRGRVHLYAPVTRHQLCLGQDARHLPNL